MSKRKKGVEEVEVSIEDPNTYLPALADILSDPTDTRSDEQIAKDLEISPRTIKSLRKDTDFMIPVYQRFMANLSSTYPHIVRMLFENVKMGDTAAARTLIEQIEKARGQRGDGTARTYEHLNDAELENEITRLLTETHADDVAYVDVESDAEIQNKLDRVGSRGGVQTLEAGTASGTPDREEETPGDQ